MGGSQFPETQDHSMPSKSDPPRVRSSTGLQGSPGDSNEHGLVLRTGWDRTIQAKGQISEPLMIWVRVASY